MIFPEIHPDADAARGIDLELPVFLYVPELTGTCIIEHEHDGGQSAWQVDLPVQKLRDADRSVPFLVDVLEVAREVTPFPGIASVSRIDEVILDDRNPPELIWNPRGVLSRSD